MLFDIDNALDPPVPSFVTDVELTLYSVVGIGNCRLSVESTTYDI
jgi:hypothetical protein